MTRVLIVSPFPENRAKIRAMIPADMLEPITLAESTGPTDVPVDAFDVLLFDGDPDDLADLRGEARSAAPVIVLMEDRNRSLERAAIEAGAMDAVAWDDLTTALLERAIRYALERRDLEHRMSNLALFDPDTGLARQPLFWEILSLAVKRARRNQDHLAVLYIHLEGLEGGAEAMDRSSRVAVSRAAANRLTGLLRSSDTVARVEAGHIAVLVESMPRVEDIQTVAEKIVNTIRAPLEVNDHATRLSASVGIAMYPSGAFSAEALISDAAAAMTLAREAGGDAFKFA